MAGFPFDGIFLGVAFIPFQAMTNDGKRFFGPLRLVAQDIGFSVREQGFDSPRGYWVDCCKALTCKALLNNLQGPLSSEK